MPPTADRNRGWMGRLTRLLAGVFAGEANSLSPSDTIAEAWDEVHAATPPGWVVGRPSYHDERNEWLLYAFDPSERLVVGLRSREWTASAESAEAVVCEMARCLRLIGEGRLPK